MRLTIGRICFILLVTKVTDEFYGGLMAAKKVVTREKILNAAYSLVRKKGMAALNARAVASALGCSTRPVYLSFKGMEELKSAVAEMINSTYRAYLQNEADGGKYSEYKAYGMGYIRFAREEKQLFSYLFMRSRDKEEYIADGGELSGVFGALNAATGLTGDLAERFHAECWIFVHGIATMIATSYLDIDDDTVSALLSDMFIGLKARFGQAQNS